MNHHRITREGQETAALYALGSLSQLEASAFDLHIREGCPACETELRQFDQVAQVLGSVVETVAPPPYLRDLLNARIERESTEAASSSPATVIAFPDQSSTPELRSTRRSSTASGWLPWAIAAALVIAFGYTFVAWRTERQNLQAARERDKAGSAEPEENARLKEDLDKEKATSGELTQINSVLAAPQWRIIPLAGQEPTPGAS
ncbi:MAG: hypothetical protein ABJB97_12190, partial [Acidobacteriota bacterium]